MLSAAHTIAAHDDDDVADDDYHEAYRIDDAPFVL